MKAGVALVGALMLALGAPTNAAPPPSSGPTPDAGGAAPAGAASPPAWDLRWMVTGRRLPAPKPPRRTGALELLGASLYRARCASCHGDSGDGRGPIAAGLRVPPTNFTAGVYKLRSTPTGSIPTDADLFATVVGRDDQKGLHVGHDRRGQPHQRGVGVGHETRQHRDADLTRKDRPLAGLIIRHEVRDYATWKAAFDKHGQARARAGIVGHAVNRSVRNANVVVVYLQAESLDSLRTFAAAPDLKAVMAAAGVIEPPDLSFVRGGAWQT